jgi:putative membrane protein
MIVGTRPRFRQIIIEVWKPLTILFVWDVAVTAFHMMTPIKEPPLPTALFGTAIALFMGFRTNAAYARWWEARTLWGALINASRSLARITRSLTRGEPQGSEMRDDIILHQIAFAHSMRCQLRRQSPYEEIARVAGSDVADRALARTNPANALLEDISCIYSDALAEGRINAIQQATVERV